MLLGTFLLNAPVLSDVPGHLSGSAPKFLNWLSHAFAQMGNFALITLLAAGGTWFFLRVFEAALRTFFTALKNRTTTTPELRLVQRLDTAAAIARSLGKTAIIFFAATTVLSSLGVNVGPILASAGIVGLAVGFGAQSLVKDVISGFFIIMEDQFGVGDVVELNGHQGLVERMNLRFSQIRNGQGSLVSIPNGQVATVVNHSKQWARAVVDINVPLHIPPDQLRVAMLRAAKLVQEEMPSNILEPVELVGVEALKDSEAIMRVQFKTPPLEQWKVARAYREALWPEILKLKEAK